MHLPQVFPGSAQVAGFGALGTHSKPQFCRLPKDIIIMPRLLTNDDNPIGAKSSRCIRKHYSKQGTVRLGRSRYLNAMAKRLIEELISIDTELMSIRHVRHEQCDRCGDEVELMSILVPGSEFVCVECLCPAHAAGVSVGFQPRISRL